MSEHETDVDDLSDFEEVIDLLRDGPVDHADETPPPSVWASIESELRGAPTDATVTPIDAGRSNRRWRRPAAWVTLAAAVLLVAVPVGLSLRSTDDEVVVAMADLAVIGTEPGSPSSAELIEAGDDVVLDLDTGWSASGDEFLELWLLDVDDEGSVVDLVSLGPVDGSGRYDVPDGVDLARFTVVDISLEPDDGDESHSGNSVLRGGLV